MSIKRPKLEFQPINWVQRIALYVTHSKCFLVGSNNTQTAFKVLKIDRTETENLSIVDDGIEYNYPKIRETLMRLDHGNRIRENPTKPGLTKIVSSFGIIGFVRFLHGYYVILIIKRRKVASIGYHTIYKVEETKLVYIPNELPDKFMKEEQRYVKAFNNIDLTSNFYFSYSYDISHSLQYNLSPIRPTKFFQDEPSTSRQQFNFNSERYRVNNQEQAIKQQDSLPNPILVKTKPSDRFIWNSHLIDFEGLHEDWKTRLIHGFVAQANLCVYSKPIYITLIARRSRRYCGTRFLKRGLNLDGDVANEVETEQIVHDASVSNFSQGFFTSFVQLRGSLPDRWSQDTSNKISKPPIVQDFVDPYHEPTAKHFNDLLKRYGSPVVVLNLVKQKEAKPHESILSNMLNTSVKYLNQFLPQQHIIRLISFDMAKSNKSRHENVMLRLGKIGFNIVRVVGIFQSWRSARKSNYDNTYTLHLRQRTFNRKPSSSRIGGFRLRNGQCLQNGLVRVNCVDSLDRTNTAQFVLGKVALAFQLQALGVLIEPSLEYDTDAVRLLEQLYEDHGDTIALQYGGSFLVHRVKTYRKVAPITSQSSEIMQTLSRYYSNTFSDADKQNVINIFLGVRKASLFDLQAEPITDYYWHNRLLLKPFDLDDKKLKTFKQWWDKELEECLPRAHIEWKKESNSYALDIKDNYNSSTTIYERINYYLDAYRPYEITYLASSFSMQILHTIKDFMPNNSTDFSPFSLRLGPGKLKEKYLDSSKRLPPNPSVYGLPTSSRSEISIINDSDLSDESELDDLSTHPTAMNTSSFMLMNSSSRRRNSHYNYTLVRYLNDYDTMSATNYDEQYGGMTLPIANEDFNLYKGYADFFKVSPARDGQAPNTNDQLSIQITTFSASANCFQQNSAPTPDIADKHGIFNLTNPPTSSQTQQFIPVPLSELDLATFTNYVNSNMC